jgi:hypothetical protein
MVQATGFHRGKRLRAARADDARGIYSAEFMDQYSLGPCLGATSYVACLLPKRGNIGSKTAERTAARTA